MLLASSRRKVWPHVAAHPFSYPVVAEAKCLDIILLAMGMSGGAKLHFSEASVAASHALATNYPTQHLM